MLNFIATGITAYLLINYFRNRSVNHGRDATCCPASGRLPSLNDLLEKIGIDLPDDTVLSGFLPFAIVVGIAFYIIIYRTRFGFDLRTSGRTRTRPGRRASTRRR